MKTKFIFLFPLCLVIASCKTQTESFDSSFPENYTETSTNNDEIILDGNLPFEEQVTEEDKVYMIRDVFDLQNKPVTIGKNSSLYFLGGSISNGTINFDNTIIEGYAKFINCSYSGTLNNKTVKFEWFDFTSSDTSLFALSYSKNKYVKHDYTKIQQILDCCKSGTLIIVDKVYTLSAPLKIKKELSFEGLDKSEGIYSNMLQNLEYGFVIMKNNTAFIVENGGDVSMTGISVVGNMGLYIGGALWEKEYTNGTPLKSPLSLAGIEIQKGGKLSSVLNSSFVAFTYGIKSEGGTIGLIRNSYCSSCRYGFWAKDTNDFECRGCRFNTNELNFHFHEKNADSVKDNKIPITQSSGDQIYRIGGGVYVENCQNANFNKCRFEFNFIHAIVKGSGKNVTFEGCIFDTGTISQVMVYNDGDEISSPAMDNITFSNSTFARGARCDIQGQQSVSGYSILYITDKNNRGSNINFLNNIVSDDMEVDKSIDVVYEENIFLIHNTSTENTNLTVKNNSFISGMAKNVYKSVEGSSGIFNITASGNDYGTITLLNDDSNVINLQ